MTTAKKNPAKKTTDFTISTTSRRKTAAMGDSRRFGIFFVASPSMMESETKVATSCHINTGVPESSDKKQGIKVEVTGLPFVADLFVKLQFASAKFVRFGLDSTRLAHHAGGIVVAS